MTTPFKVPIRNIFVMLSYANEMYDLVEEFTTVDEEVITYDFLARKFYEEAETIIQHTYVKSYVSYTEETSVISGKMMMNKSMPHLITQRPVVVCEKDQYSGNVLLNQMMKTTLTSLVRNKLVKEETRKKCYMLWENLHNVDEVYLTKREFMQIVYNRHNIHYKRMIHLARLLFELNLLSHRSGDWSLYTVDLQAHEMNELFELFLLNFYKLEQNDYIVKSEKMTWDLTGDTRFLPYMQTDVSLTHRNKDRKIIIDAKYYKNMFQTFHTKQSFHSPNMYQMFAYLAHQPYSLGKVRGVLIYPYNGYSLYEVYEWDERIKMEMMTIDLSESWKVIYERLINIV